MKGLLARWMRIDPKRVATARGAFAGTLEGQRTSIVLALGGASLATAFELLRPWPVQWVVDHVVLERETNSALASTSIGVQLLVACSSVILLGLGIGLANRLATIRTAEVGRKVATRLRRRVFEHIHRLELPAFSRHSSGDLLVRIMGDVGMVRDLLFSSWVSLTGPGLLFLGTAVVLTWLDPWLMVLALVPLPFLLFGVRRSSRTLRALTKKQREKEGDAASLAAQTLRQVRLVKALGAEALLTRRFVKDARSGERAGVAAARLAARVGAMSQILTSIGMAAIVAVGALRVRSGSLSPGELLVAISYIRSLYKPLRKVTSEGTKLGKSTACAERLMDVLALPTERTDIGERLGEFGGKLELDGVSFAYGTGRGAVRSLSFAFPVCGTTLIVGPNGAGKSTLLALIQGLLRPTSGRILLDSRDLAGIRLADWRAHVAYVTQDVSLFSGTLRDNLLLSRPDADDAEVLAALRSAEADELIERLPNGLDSVLGEGGNTVSGGEARRLMLARAALRDADVIIFDEPLAGVDPESRPAISRAIREIAAGRTAIIVTHDQIDELGADCVLTLDGGRIVDITRRAAGAGASS